MKRMLLLTLVIMVAVSSIGMVAFAAEEEEGGGVMPDSSFYFLQQVSEKVQLGLKHAPEERAAFVAQLLERRTQEVQAMVAAGKDDLVETLSGRMADLSEQARAEVEKARARAEEEGVEPDQGEGDADMDLAAVAEKVADATLTADEVLAGLLETVPEQARPAIEMAREAAQTGRDVAVGVLGKIANGELPGNKDMASHVLGKVKSIFDRLGLELPFGNIGPGAGDGTDGDDQRPEGADKGH